MWPSGRVAGKRQARQTPSDREHIILLPDSGRKLRTDVASGNINRMSVVALRELLPATAAKSESYLVTGYGLKHIFIMMACRS